MDSHHLLELVYTEIRNISEWIISLLGGFGDWCLWFFHIIFHPLILRAVILEAIDLIWYQVGYKVRSQHTLDLRALRRARGYGGDAEARHLCVDSHQVLGDVFRRVISHATGLSFSWSVNSDIL